MRAMAWVNILKRHKLFLGYCSALLIAAVIFYALPAYPGLELKSEISPSPLSELAIYGDLEEADWPVVKNNWDFSSPDASLFLTTSNKYLDTIVVVAETAPEGRILVTEYVASSYMAERMAAHKVSLSGTKLGIHRPKSSIELYYFARDILTQFDSEPQPSLADGWFSEILRSISPEALIYIQVPKGMKVEAEERMRLEFSSDY